MAASAADAQAGLADELSALDSERTQEAGGGTGVATEPGEVLVEPAAGLRTCVDVVVGARRLAGWAVWLELLALARLLTAWSGRPPITDERVGPDPCADADPALAGRLHAVVADLGLWVPTGGHVDTAGLADAFVASEVAAASGQSGPGAAGRVAAAAALFLTDRLPRTRALLRAGLIDNTKLRTILSGTALVGDDAVCRLVEARLISDADLALAVAAGEPAHVLDVLDPESNPGGPGSVLPWVTRVSNPALTARIAKVVALLDAEAAAERAAKARAKRATWARALSDGMGQISVQTGREAITAIITDLDACAASAKAGGDTRTPDQIRTDELVHRMSLGAFGAPAGAAGETVGGTPGGVVGARALRVNVTMPLSTWLGLADEPALLDGYGPIPAALARQIAAEAARDHPTTTTWRCVPVDDVHRTVLGVGDTIPTPRHDPTSRIRALATTADPCCVWPNCSRRAVTCDIDHRVPYAQGGVTCPCNLAPLCRRHHRLKGTGLIAPVPHPRAAHGARLHTLDERQTDDAGTTMQPSTPVGAVRWTSWTGRTYTYTPPPAAEAPLTAAERDTLQRAAHRRLDPSATYPDSGDPDLDLDDARECAAHPATRARFAEIARALRPWSLSDDDRPDNGTPGTDAWRYTITRADRPRRTPTPRATDPSACDDECPF